MSDITTTQVDGIDFHVIDFSRMPEDSVIKPGFYYTFAVQDEQPEVDGTGYGEPGIMLNGPYPDLETANAKALAYLKAALTAVASEAEIAFVDEVENQGEFARSGPG